MRVVNVPHPADTFARQERRFALALLAPALLVLLLTTTAPLFYLAWNSLNRIDLGMPWLSGWKIRHAHGPNKATAAMA